MSSSVSATIHHLRLASEYMKDFIRTYPDSFGARCFKRYDEKLNWMFKDMLSNPILTDEIRNGIRDDLNSDLLVIPSITEKAHQLTPELRQLAEEMIDIMLEGKSFRIEHREE